MRDQKSSKIITHNGIAHRDDFLACCIVLAYDSQVISIERRDPREDEIKDKDCWVLDIGQKFNPELKAFDHHHMINANDCTFSLLLKYLHLYESALKVFQWIAPSILLDITGPNEIFSKYNVSKSTFYQLQSPVESFMISLFSEKKSIAHNDSLFQIMHNMGKSILYNILNYERLTKEVERKAIALQKRGVPVIGYLDEPVSQILTQVLVQFKGTRFRGISGGLSIMKDNRHEECLRAFRYGTDKRINLKRLEEKFNIEFIHEGGFLCVFEIKNQSKQHEKQLIEEVAETVIA